MYKRYKKEQEQLKNVTLTKKKIKATPQLRNDASKQNSKDSKQNQDTSTSLNDNFKNELLVAKYSPKNQSKTSVKSFDGVQRKPKKRKRRKIFLCFKCFKKKKNKKRKANDEMLDTEEKTNVDSSLKLNKIISKSASKVSLFKPVKSPEKVQSDETENNKNDIESTITPHYKSKNPNFNSNKISKQNNTTNEEKVTLPISSELYDLNKTNLKDQEYHDNAIKKTDAQQKLKRFNKSEATNTAIADLQTNGELSNPEFMKEEVSKNMTNAKIAVNEKQNVKVMDKEQNSDLEHRKKTVMFKNSNEKNSFNEKKSFEISSFLPKFTKEDTVKPNPSESESFPQISCPMCLQNVTTMKSLYANELKKESGSVFISINNYYSDKWEKQMKKIKIYPQMRTVQTSVRPRSRDISTITDYKVINSISNDDVQYVNCERNSSDEKITVCRSRRK